MQGVKLRDPLSVMQELCHGFASITEHDQAVDSTLRWLHEAIGTHEAEVRVVLPDNGGRLRLAGSGGDRVSQGRLRSSRRRQAFSEKHPVRVRLRGAGNQVLAIVPLVTRGESVGVVEVIAASEQIDRRWELIRSVAGQAAVVVRNVRERQEAEQVVEGMSAVVKLARFLGGARNPDVALRVAVDTIGRQLRLPAAGVLRGAPGHRRVVHLRGIPRGRRQELSSALHGARLGRSHVERRRLEKRLRVLLGIEAIQVIDAGNAVLLVVGASPRTLVFLKGVGELLAEALDPSPDGRWPDTGGGGTALGLAWTAHEIRGPLLGIRTALDYVLAVNGVDEGTELLVSTRREVDRLSGLVDPLLRWSTEPGSLRRRNVDLADVARQAAESAGFEQDDRRVTVVASGPISCRIDVAQLRTAIVNLVRNALAYSPPGSPVVVSVSRRGGFGVVAVHDRGPGLPVDDRERVFEPLVRGPNGMPARRGSGLGLFIARRIVEAHGGEVTFRARRGGTAFQIELPLEDQRRQSSAS